MASDTYVFVQVPLRQAEQLLALVNDHVEFLSGEEGEEVAVADWEGLAQDLERGIAKAIRSKTPFTDGLRAVLVKDGLLPAKPVFEGLPDWVQRWAVEGDDMDCPWCGATDSIKTQDGVTLCSVCGRQEQNSLNAEQDNEEEAGYGEE